MTPSRANLGQKVRGAQESLIKLLRAFQSSSLADIQRACGLISSTHPTMDPAIGMQCPKLAGLTYLKGEPLPIGQPSSDGKRRVFVLEFWATWWVCFSLLAGRIFPCAWMGRACVHADSAPSSPALQHSMH